MFDNRWHLIPVNDLRDHDDSVDFWCHPTPDQEDETVVIHHSMDRREHTYEQGILQ